MPIVKIDSKKFYSLYEIARDDLFETGAESFTDKKNKSRAIITSDKFGGNILQSMMVPDLLRGKKYAIQGVNIIRWLANKDDATNNKNN
jgi:hypothetical protein